MMCPGVDPHRPETPCAGGIWQGERQCSMRARNRGGEEDARRGRGTVSWHARQPLRPRCSVPAVASPVQPPPRSLSASSRAPDEPEDNTRTVPVAQTRPQLSTRRTDPSIMTLRVAHCRWADQWGRRQGNRAFVAQTHAMRGATEPHLHLRFQLQAALLGQRRLARLLRGARRHRGLLRGPALFLRLLGHPHLQRPVESWISTMVKSAAARRTARQQDELHNSQQASSVSPWTSILLCACRK